MKRIFKTKNFGPWMKKVGLSDPALCKAVVEMEHGLIDADLGGGVVKKRISLPGKGKSGGVRTLVATIKITIGFLCMDPLRMNGLILIKWN